MLFYLSLAVTVAGVVLSLLFFVPRFRQKGFENVGITMFIVGGISLLSTESPRIRSKVSAAEVETSPLPLAVPVVESMQDASSPVQVTVDNIIVGVSSDSGGIFSVILASQLSTLRGHEIYVGPLGQMLGRDMVPLDSSNLRRTVTVKGGLITGLPDRIGIFVRFYNGHEHRSCEFTVSSEEHSTGMISECPKAP